MNRREFIGLSAGLAALPALGQDDAGLVVHEWGVLSVAYASPWGNVRAGSAKEAAEREAAKLPPFVATWEAAVGATIEKWKNEPVMVFKPVIYFYPPKRMTVAVCVAVPAGRPKAWWPNTADYGPKPDLPVRGGRLGELGDEHAPPSLEEIKPEKGLLMWKDLVIDPALAVDRPAGGWWPVARKVDAAAVQAGAEVDRFVFYDALTIFEPRVEIEWLKGGGVRIRNASDDVYPHVFAIRVRNGNCESAYGKSLGKGEQVELKLEAGVPRVMATLLVESGLYRKEAEGLVEIWKDEFFGADGVRVLLVTPRTVYDRLLPLSVAPAPARVERVLIAHIECVDDGRRAQIATWIEQLSSNELDDRMAADARLRELGPLAHAQIREALALTKDPDLRTRLEAILSRK